MLTKRKSWEKHTLEAGSVVLAMGVKLNLNLMEALEGNYGVS